MSETLLQISGLTKRYKGQTALDGLSLTLEEGHIYALLGDLGSGRTTLLRCVAGLTKPDGGEISLFGRPTAELTAARRELGLLVDAPAYYPDLSVANNLLLQCRVLGDVPKKRIGVLMKALKIHPRDTGRRTVGGCPATIKLRLAIAQAFLGAPRLLLLDEVYSGLDSDDSALLHALIGAEMAARPMSLLLTGQFFSELYPIATDYLLLDKGKLIAAFSREQLAARLPEGIHKPSEYEAFYEGLKKEARA